jgi:hypothetical protein
VKGLKLIAASALIPKEMAMPKSAIKSAYAAQDIITMKIMKNARFAKNYALNALGPRLTALYAMMMKAMSLWMGMYAYAAWAIIKMEHLALNATQDIITMKIMKNARFAKNYALNALGPRLTALYAMMMKAMSL